MEAEKLSKLEKQSTYMMDRYLAHWTILLEDININLEMSAYKFIGVQNLKYLSTIVITQDNEIQVDQIY